MADGYKAASASLDSLRGTAGTLHVDRAKRLTGMQWGAIGNRRRSQGSDRGGVHVECSERRQAARACRRRKRAWACLARWTESSQHQKWKSICFKFSETCCLACPTIKERTQRYHCKCGTSRYPVGYPKFCPRQFHVRTIV